MIGSGKILELKDYVDEYEADGILFNMELSSTQLRNLEEACEIKIIDRTMLILDIFASRAVTKEGKLQVELAQHQYRLPRLAHYSPYLSRLGGGIGTRGPGETKLESDRRHIQREIKQLKKKLLSLSKHRKMARSKRSRSQLPIVCLLGYTNAGKSSILNAMVNLSTSSQNEVEAKDMLFASLQPFTRRIENERQTFLMSDTVGFVSDLPTNLIAAFESSIEEIRYADVLIHVVDASSKQIETHLQTVQDILKQFDLTSKTLIVYFNKLDKVDNGVSDIYVDADIIMKGSALNKQDMQLLFEILINEVSHDEQ